jgi:hypothetical protein
MKMSKEQKIPLSSPRNWVNPSNPKLDWDYVFGKKNMNQDEIEEMVRKVEGAKYDQHHFVIEKSIEEGRERYYFFETRKARIDRHIMIALQSIIFVFLIILLYGTFRTTTI